MVNYALNSLSTADYGKGSLKEERDIFTPAAEQTRQCVARVFLTSDRVSINRTNSSFTTIFCESVISSDYYQHICLEDLFISFISFYCNDSFWDSNTCCHFAAKSKQCAICALFTCPSGPCEKVSYATLGFFLFNYGARPTVTFFFETYNNIFSQYGYGFVYKPKDRNQ